LPVRETDGGEGRDGGESERFPVTGKIGVEISSRRENGQTFHNDKIILSEIKHFFTSSEKAMETIFGFVSSLTFSDKKYSFSEACNLKYIRTFHGLFR
jgi:hypothetical protein